MLRPSISMPRSRSMLVHSYPIPQDKSPTCRTETDKPSPIQIFAWFIFTFLLWILTIRSTLAFSSLFFTVWITFICLGTAYLDARNTADGHPHKGLTVAGGAFGIVAAFIAWYNMLAGIADPSNSFFAIPVVHFPWSEKGRSQRKRDDDSAV